MGGRAEQIGGWMRGGGVNFISEEDKKGGAWWDGGVDLYDSDRGKEREGDIDGELRTEEWT